MLSVPLSIGTEGTTGAKPERLGIENLISDLGR